MRKRLLFPFLGVLLLLSGFGAAEAFAGTCGDAYCSAADETAASCPQDCVLPATAACATCTISNVTACGCQTCASGSVYYASNCSKCGQYTTTDKYGNTYPLYDKNGPVCKSCTKTESDCSKFGCAVPKTCTVTDCSYCGTQSGQAIGGKAFVLYMHGRGQITWPDGGQVSHKSGWQHVYFTYNGDLALNDTAIVTQLKNAFTAYCSNGNSCIAMCYSAGCLRTLHTLGQLQSSQVSGLLKIVAAGSAAGGSELAVTRLKSQLRKIGKWVAIVKIVVSVALAVAGAYGVFSGPMSAVGNAVQTATNGVITSAGFQGAVGAIGMVWTGVDIFNFVTGKSTQQETAYVISQAQSTNALLREVPIDTDLDPNVARGTWGYIQNKAFAPMYHLAGHKDICVKKKVLFKSFKICGNKDLPGSKGDGVVPMHSSCGFASKAAYTNCCSSGSKYLNRYIGSGLAETSPGSNQFVVTTPCSWNADHTTIPIVGIMAGSLALATTVTMTTPESENLDAWMDCNMLYDECDMADDGYKNAYLTMPGTKNATVMAYAKTFAADSCNTCDKNGFTRCEYFSQAMTGASYYAPTVDEVPDLCTTCANAATGAQDRCCYVGPAGLTTKRQTGSRAVGRADGRAANTLIGGEYYLDSTCVSYDKYGTCLRWNTSTCSAYDKYGTCTSWSGRPHACTGVSMAGWRCSSYDKFGTCIYWSRN